MALSALNQSILRNYRKQQQLRRAESAFAALVASPHDFGSIAADASSANGLVMPAGAELSLSLDDAWAAGDISITTSDGRVISARAGVADQVVTVSAFFRRGVSIEITRAAGAAAGALSVYLATRGRRILIGNATFTA